jgi:hypothetical protein
MLALTVMPALTPVQRIQDPIRASWIRDPQWTQEAILRAALAEVGAKEGKPPAPVAMMLLRAPAAIPSPKGVPEEPQILAGRADPRPARVARHRRAVPVDLRLPGGRVTRGWSPSLWRCSSS